MNIYLNGHIYRLSQSCPPTSNVPGGADQTPLDEEEDVVAGDLSTYSLMSGSRVLR